MSEKITSLINEKIIAEANERRDLHIIIAALANKAGIDITDVDKASRLISEIAYSVSGGDVEIAESTIANALEEVFDTIEGLVRMEQENV